jgi:hypothetical protein
LTGDFTNLINGVLDGGFTLVRVVTDMGVDGNFFEAGNLVDVCEA